MDLLLDACKAHIASQGSTLYSSSLDVTREAGLTAAAERLKAEVIACNEIHSRLVRNHMAKQNSSQHYPPNGSGN